MKSFQVPQFIDNEAKVIGPLSFSQTVVLVVVVLSCVAIFYLFDIIISSILIFIIAIVTGLMLFTKIDGFPSYKLIIPLLRHLWLPKKYSWAKEKVIHTKKITSEPEIKKEVGKQIKTSQIKTLAKNLKNGQK